MLSRIPQRILIYDNDPVSTGPTSIREIYKSLLSAIDSNQYHVDRVCSEYLNEEKWEDSTALLIFPGGRARPHYQNLANGGNQKIINYVKSGGNYLGLCAGGYYGASTTIFEKTGQNEVLDFGPLNFYPGSAEGPAYGLEKFQYESEAGAQLAKIICSFSSMEGQILPVYFNGGCFFHGHTNHEDVTVLARYSDILSNPIAVVECKVGKGKAILSGVHFEYGLDEKQNNPKITEKINDALEKFESQRLLFFKNILGFLRIPAVNV